MANSDSSKPAADQSRASYADDAKARRVLQVDGSGDVVSPSGLVDVAYDYVSVAYPDTVTEVYTFKTGGAGGTTVATVTLVYSDATKYRLVTATKT